MNKLPMSNIRILQRDQVRRYPHLRDLPLTHVEPGRIEIMIGQDNAKFFIQDDTAPGRNEDEPYGVKTKIGWYVNGFKCKSEPAQNFTTTVNSFHCNADTIESKLDRLWAIEAEPIVDNYSPNAKKVEDLWIDKTVVIKGRISMPLPFVDDKPSFPNNRTYVAKRMESLKRKFHKDDSLRITFSATMLEYFATGIAEHAPERPIAGLEWYIPLLAVFSDKKPGKCRVVCDCPAKFQGVSLNGKIHQGPDYTCNMAGIDIA